MSRDYPAIVKLNDWGKYGAAALVMPSAREIVSPVVAKAQTQPKGRPVKPVRGSLNGTEQRYSKRLDARIVAGEVAAYWYEAIKFRLADGSWF